MNKKYIMYIDRESISFKDTKGNNYMMTRVRDFLSSIFSKMKSFNKVKAVTTVMILFVTSGLTFSGCGTRTVDTKPDTSSSEATITPDSSATPEPTDTPTPTVTPTAAPTDATTDTPTDTPVDTPVGTPVPAVEPVQPVVPAPTEATAQSNGCTPTYVAEQGHYVTVVDKPASTTYVIDTPAYDEPTYTEMIYVYLTGHTYKTYKEYTNSLDSGDAYTVKDIQTGTVHHDAVGHNVTVPAVTHQEYVVDVPAHTEGC